jgi:capsular exopolysaccharide synthesis family protein
MDPDFVPDQPSVPFSHYLWILRRNLWKIAIFVATCVLVSALVCSRLQKIYESTATIDVDRQAPSEVVGQDSTRSGSPGDADQFLATQIKMIQSDAVLRPVAEEFHLLDQEGQLKSASQEDVQSIAQSPISLGRLKVTRPPNTYLLLISYSSPDRILAARVANAIANSYLAHTYDLRIRSSASLSTFMESQLDGLRAKMEKSGQALAQFERDLDVINPEEKTNILSARLLQLNTEYTTAQAERVSKEAAFNAMKSGSLEAAQVSTQGESLAKLGDAVNEAQQRLQHVKSVYGPNFPETKKAAADLAVVQEQFEHARSNTAGRIEVQYREALNREQMLQRTVGETKAEWDRVNAHSFQYQQLKREADGDKALYDELIKKIRESDINAGFQNNNIRISDIARPSRTPVFPKTGLTMLVSFVFSTLLGIAAVLLLDSLDTTLRAPDEASRFLAVDIIGMLPRDPRSVSLLSKPTSAPQSIVLQPRTEPDDKGYYRNTGNFEEAVRRIRNTILLSDFDGRLNSVLVTSATPSEGKSTTALHLAIANADRGRKTLILDGDLRRPSIHAKLGLSPKIGLSNVLTGELPWQDAVIPIVGRPNLFFLPSGPGSHRAADLVGPRLSTLLNEFAREYELVILDSPPLLGFAEGLQMATAADGVLIVALAGETKRKAVATVISELTRLRANIIGVVLNQVTRNTSAEGYAYYGYYKYGYVEKTEG